MQKKVIYLSVVLLLIFSIAQIASAASQTQPRHPGDHLKSLNLTDEQYSKLRDMQKNHYQETRELKINLQDKFFELKQLKLQKNPDEAKVEAKLKEVKELKNKLSEIRQKNKAEFESILTEEQKKMLPEKSGPNGFGPGCHKGSCQ